MERLALSRGNARQFTKLLLSLLSHIGKKQRDAKAELNRRSQACEVLADTGIRVAKVFPSAPKPASGHYFDRARSLPADRVQLGENGAANPG